MVTIKSSLSFLTSIAISCSILSTSAAADESLDSFLELDLEALLSMEVTSVSKKKQKLSEAPAAIFVITADDIRRSGVTSIPDALRMAPGLQVARIDSNKWAVSSRGFNAQYANKLLVLIDGRSVYTPSFSGVYWEIQDTVLQDIDRIEVIRGPGATLWGSNAVNGVINIITKHASKTQDGLFVVGAGDEEKGFSSLRYGTQLNDETYARVFLKYNDRDSSYAKDLDMEAGDDWQSLRSGFRIDGSSVYGDSWTVQGDIYDTDQNQIIKSLWLDPSIPGNLPPYLDTNVDDAFTASGHNLLGRWDYSFSNDSKITLQSYFDHTERDEDILVQEHDTFDIDFQHQYSAIEGHDIIWGLGYRRIEDKFKNSFGVSLNPEKQTSTLVSAFIQDEIEISEDKRLTIGTKFEDNDYTGSEIQPSVRFLWLPEPGQTIWTSLSRAARTPSRVENDSTIVSVIIPPTPPFVPAAVVASVKGSNDFESEELTAFEVGYRIQPSETMSFDLSVFHNQYKNIGTFETVSMFGDAVFDNKRDATSEGLELVHDWQMEEWIRLQTTYSYIHLSEKSDADSNDTISGPLIKGSSPKHQFSVRSLMDVSESMSLNIWFYYVDELEASAYSTSEKVDDYSSLNASLLWTIDDDMEFALLGHNLTEERHAEFVGENFLTLTEIERSIYAQLSVKF